MGGFYHDIQKNSGLMSVTLHPNRELINGKWSDVKNPEPDSNVGSGSSNSGKSEGKVYKYSKDPILRSVIRDNFTIGISNSWTDNTGNDSLTSLFNSAKTLAPYISHIRDNAEKMKNIGELMKQNGDDSFMAAAVSTMHNIVSRSIPYLDKGSDLLNRAVVIQGTRFSYYSGTGVSFGNLDMKATIFNDYVKDADGNIKLVTVIDTLNQLSPYIMGEYVPYDEEDSDNSLNTFVAWQKPPGDFEADIKNIDVVQKGTLKLKFGSYYCIDNLVIKDVQAVFSKQLIKVPGEIGKVYPLYCDIQITFQPASRYTDKSLREFIGGLKTTNEQKELADTLINGIEEARKNMYKVR